MRNRYQAVFLDVGGTVVDPDPSFAAVVARVCADSGLPVTTEQVERLEPVVWAEVNARGYPLTAEDSRRFWRDIYVLFARHLGVPAHDGLAERIYSTFADLRTWRLYPDAADAIAALRARGYRLGVVSNWEGWLEDLLEHLGVRSHFDLVVSSTRAGVAKPSPRIYRLALDQAGLAPADVVHVGDSPTHDAAPARSVGITPVLVDRLGRHPDFSGLRVGDLREIVDLLDA